MRTKLCLGYEKSDWPWPALLEFLTLLWCDTNEIGLKLLNIRGNQNQPRLFWPLLQLQ
jgi:hypothetical protein